MIPTSEQVTLRGQVFKLLDTHGPTCGYREALLRDIRVSDQVFRNYKEEWRAARGLEGAALGRPYKVVQDKPVEEDVLAITDESTLARTPARRTGAKAPPKAPVERQSSITAQRGEFNLADGSIKMQADLPLEVLAYYVGDRARCEEQGYEVPTLGEWLTELVNEYHEMLQVGYQIGGQLYDDPETAAALIKNTEADDVGDRGEDGNGDDAAGAEGPDAGRVGGEDEGAGGVGQDSEGDGRTPAGGGGDEEEDSGSGG